MKKYILILLLLIPALVNGQTFEGTVKWSMKIEITDPKLKAQMEQGMKQMSDPANQSKVKEMQEKMNDPQMKAMLDANPQMKAQMENAIKVMQGGNSSSLVPSNFLFKTKGGNTLTIIQGGMMPMDLLYLKNQDKTYRLDRKNKTYSILQQGISPAQQDKASKPETKVTKTSETMKILTYNCVKYIVAVTNRGNTTNQIYWTTNEIKDFDMKGLTKQRMGDAGQQMFHEGVEGVPLKIEMVTPQGNMTMEAIEIKRESLKASDFALPADYKEVQGMF
ncbi:MAG: DUF4412 domain-containing protein [Cyclobacteriaceae bacterium]|jgi:hypothetical protein